MPSTSKKQAIAARIALAAKKGDIPKNKIKGASANMYKGMSTKELKKYTKVKESFGEMVNKILQQLNQP